MSKRMLLFAVSVLLVLFFAPSLTTDVSAQTFDDVPTGDEPDKVYAVYFYSPSCGHCQHLANDVFPVWFEEFGNDLIIVPVNVTQQGTGSLFYAACDAFNVPEDSCGAVPMMVIDETVMIGSVQIPTTGPELIRAGLANEGLPVPEFAGMDIYFAMYQEAVADSLGVVVEDAPAVEGDEVVAGAIPADSSSGNDDANSSGGGGDGEVVLDLNESQSIADRLSADPVANAVAVFVLIGLVSSVGLTVWYGQRGALDSLKLDKPALALTALVGVGVALSLVAQSGDDALATGIAWGVFVLVGLGTMFVVLALVDSSLMQLAIRWGIPLVALAGLVVAVYLAHVEMTGNEATCGAIGNCNAVQQSEYSSLFGIPIGVLGVVGYVLILLSWGAGRFLNVRAADAILLGLILFGTAFSIYLTFLEPFVIGATCAWCLMSALTMLLLLWLVAPIGWDSFRALRGESLQTTG